MTRKTQIIKKKLTPLMVSLTLLAGAGLNLKTLALETSPATTTTRGSDYSLEPDAKDHQAERTEISTLLTNLESQWNAHDIDGLMSNYSEEYTNNDGLNKKAVRLITQRFWSQYPDSKSTSKIKQIRVDGGFATVESKDVATGTTDKENQSIGTKGDLESVSEGQVYLKKQGNSWKIIGDRIDFEKVRVSFGLGKQLNSNFTAPEQVRSGKQFSAKVELNLPIGLSAVGTITSQPLKYPQSDDKESAEKLLRGLDNNALERIMQTNKENRNELIMATVGIMNSARHLLGITVLTRRVNVVPSLPDETEKLEDIAEKSDSAKKSETASAGEDKSKADSSASSEDKDAKKEEAKKDESPKTESKETKETKESDSKDSKKSQSKKKEKSESGAKKKKSSTDKE